MKNSIHPGGELPSAIRALAEIEELKRHPPERKTVEELRDSLDDAITDAGEAADNIKDPKERIRSLQIVKNILESGIRIIDEALAEKKQ